MSSKIVTALAILVSAVGGVALGVVVHEKKPWTMVGAPRDEPASRAAGVPPVPAPSAVVTSASASNGANASSSAPPASSAMSSASPIPSASGSAAVAPSTSASTSAAAQQNAPTDGPAACMRSLFPADTFESPEPDLAKLCEDKSASKFGKRVKELMVGASKGRMTGGMKEWGILGIYQLAAMSAMRGHCCPDAPPLDVAKAPGTCPALSVSMTSISSATRIGGSASEIDAAVATFDKDVHCVIRAEQSQLFGDYGALGGGEGTALEKKHRPHPASYAPLLIAFPRPYPRIGGTRFLTSRAVSAAEERCRDMRRAWRAAFYFTVGLSSYLLGCGGAATSDTSRAKLEEKRAEIDVCHLGNGALTSLTHTGSAVSLARVRSRLVAYVANRPEKRLDVVDLIRQEKIGVIALAGAPEQTLILDDGRIAVTLGDRNALQTVSVGADLLELGGAATCLTDLPEGPFALASSEDGLQVAVASRAADAITFLDAPSLRLDRAINVPRAPQALLFQDEKLFVSHLGIDQLTVLDRVGSEAPRAIDLRLKPATASAPEKVLSIPRRTSQAYTLASVKLRRQPFGEKPAIDGQAPKEHRLIVPLVSVDPGDEQVRGTYYGPPPTAGLPKETPTAMIIDSDREVSEVSHILALGSRSLASECLLPRASAVRASTARLYVACRGIDQILELDALAVDPMRWVIRRFDISKGVSALAIADAENMAVTLSEFDDKLDLVNLKNGGHTTIDLAARPSTLAASYRNGRELFYRTDDAQIASDGLACSSCHPDGGDDGLTWSTPEGLRQTPMLAGRTHGTAPYGWSRNMGDLKSYIGDTIGRLGGTGLGGDDVAALASYIERMPSPERKVATSSEVIHGHDTFMRNGCGTCHLGEIGTDRVAHTFEVGTNVPIDTPSLRFVGMTAPYFHDGRYETLADLLSDKNNVMGTTAYLSPDDRKDILAYLQSL